MAAAPAEKGLGLSQSHSNSALDYSGDTFESFSEDEESQAPGSWCSTEDLEGAAVSEALESSSSLAGQSPAEEESEAVGAAAAIGRWIDAVGKGIDVKNKDTGIGPDQSVITAPAGVPALSPEELAALRAFCSSSICRMQQAQQCSRMQQQAQQCSRICRMQQQQAQQCSRMQQQAQECSRMQQQAQQCSRICRMQQQQAQECSRTPAGQRDTGDLCAVPAQLMNRILLDNTRQAVRQVTEAEIHEASTCPECQQKGAELARAAFLRHKKTLLQGAFIQEKLEKQLHSRDMLTLLGEALRSFPKPSEDPRDLWQRLKGQEMENQNQT